MLDYLGRYTHRVALSNDRLVDHREGRVRFRWRDYADHDRVKVLTLDADEFLRCVLLHVVPRGFMRIRHFGLLANRTRRRTLSRCRTLLDAPPIGAAPSESVAALMYRLTGIDLSRCPVVRRGPMQITGIVAQGPRHPAAVGDHDVSNPDPLGIDRRQRSFTRRAHRSKVASRHARATLQSP